LISQGRNENTILYLLPSFGELPRLFFFASTLYLELSLEFLKFFFFLLIIEYYITLLEILIVLSNNISNLSKTPKQIPKSPQNLKNLSQVN